jgi:hypothetical protein
MRHVKRASPDYCRRVPDLRLLVGLAVGAAVAGVGAIASFDPRVQKAVRRATDLTMRRTRSLAPTARKRASSAAKSSGRNGSRSRTATKAV